MYIIIIYEKEEQGKRSNVSWVLSVRTEFRIESEARVYFEMTVKASLNSANPVKIVLNKDTHKLASFTLNKPF